MAKIHNGYFLIADITGYTGYLSDSELDHAQGTLTELLELLIDHTRPPLVISRLAGDAVISYGLGENFLSGQTFVEMIEDTYVAFRQAINLMVMNNTCGCRACANVSNLDLKFFVHYGSFGIQRIGDHDELVGSDVNLLHRLLKNHVTEKTGVRAYTLYSDAAIQSLGIEEICASMIEHTEAYEHLGEVQVWVQDMLPAWESKKDAVRIEVSDEKLFFQVETMIAMPPERVWDYLVRPEFRRLLIGSDRQEIESRQGGRFETGSIVRCYHGDKVNLQAILEWQPFRRLVSDDRVWFLGGWIQVLNEAVLRPEGEMTRLTIRFGDVRTGWLMRLKMRANLPKIGSQVVAQFQAFVDDFRDKVEADQQFNQPNSPGRTEITPDQIAAAAAAGLPARSGETEAE